MLLSTAVNFPSGHRRFGSDAERYTDLAWGRDDRPVTPDSDAKSISSEETFETDLIYPEEVRGVLLGEVEEVAHRLRKHNLYARTITLKIRSGDFKTITRSATLDTPTQQTQELWNIAKDVFDTWAQKSFHPVRLIGMAAKDFSTSPGQLPLFTDATSEKQTRLDQALDQITQKFGKSSIHRAK
jgi:nucleotidyltransferase/DNA polymerase involved in DNA repair